MVPLRYKRTLTGLQVIVVAIHTVFVGFCLCFLNGDTPLIIVVWILDFPTTLILLPVAIFSGAFGLELGSQAWSIAIVCVGGVQWFLLTTWVFKLGLREDRWKWIWPWKNCAHPIGHCQRCGYDLFGNVSGRCPECGTTITTGLKGREE